MSPVGWMGWLIGWHSPPLWPPRSSLYRGHPILLSSHPFTFPTATPLAHPKPPLQKPNQHALPIITSIYAFEHILIKPSSDNRSSCSRLPSRDAYREEEVRINRLCNILVNAIICISNNSQLPPALPVTKLPPTLPVPKLPPIFINSFPSLTLLAAPHRYDLPTASRP